MNPLDVTVEVGCVERRVAQVLPRFLINPFSNSCPPLLILESKKDMELHFCLEGFVNVSSTLSLFTPYNEVPMSSKCSTSCFSRSVS